MTAGIHRRPAAAAAETSKRVIRKAAEQDDLESDTARRPESRIKAQGHQLETIAPSVSRLAHHGPANKYRVALCGCPPSLEPVSLYLVLVQNGGHAAPDIQARRWPDWSHRRATALQGEKVAQQVSAFGTRRSARQRAVRGGCSEDIVAMNRWAAWKNPFVDGSLAIQEGPRC